MRHSLSPGRWFGYLAKPVPVAVCKQVGDPATSKSSMGPKVARIITPGTVTDNALFEEHRGNLVVTAQIAGESFGIAALNVTSGRFSVLEVEGKEARPCIHRA